MLYQVKNERMKISSIQTGGTKAIHSPVNLQEQVRVYSPGGGGGGGAGAGAGALDVGAGLGFGAGAGVGGGAGAGPMPYVSSFTGAGGGGGGAGFGAADVGASVGAMNCLLHKGQLSTWPDLSSGTVTRRVQCGQNRSMGGV